LPSSGGRRCPLTHSVGNFQRYYKNARYNYQDLGSILTNDGRCTCEITSRIAMAKAAFNKKRALFTSKMNLELRKN
jgi:hypothetical protein